MYISVWGIIVCIRIWEDLNLAFYTTEITRNHLTTLNWFTYKLKISIGKYMGFCTCAYQISIADPNL